MSKVVMCDRCDKLVRKRKSVTFKVRDDWFYMDTPNRFNLCKECAKSFSEWMDYEGWATERKER